MTVVRAPRLLGLVAALTVVIAACVGGWLLGHQADRVITTRRGIAYATPYQAMVRSGGWTYNVPLNVPWIDSEGSVHEGSRPACLASYRHTRIEFASVDATVAVIGTRSVVWVRC